MLVVLTIIGVLLTVAIPLATNNAVRQNNQVVSLQIGSIIHFSQEEAIRRGQELRLCGASYNTNSDGEPSYLHGCASNNSWSSGVLAYQDVNNNLAYDSSERVMSYRFAKSSVVCISHSDYPDASQCRDGSFNEAAIVLTVDGNGLISEGSYSKWYLTVSQTRYSSSKYSQFSLNSYGAICNYRDIDGNLNAGC